MSQNHVVDPSPIVASSPNPDVSPPSPRGEGLRLGRHAWMVLLIALLGLLSLWRALSEPSLGLRLELDGSGRIDAHFTREAELEPLRDVRALRVGPDRVVLDPGLLAESSGILNRYDEQHRFYERHARLWALLQSDVVTVEYRHEGVSTSIEREVLPKRVDELGPRFWVPWFLGLLSLSVGLLLVLHSPQRAAALCVMLAGVGFAYIMLVLAGTSSRLLTQIDVGWQALHQAAHVAAFLQNGALCVLLWRHPTRLGGLWFVGALIVWSLAWLVADLGEWVQTINVGFRLPVALFGLLFALLFALQWRAARGDPLKRAQLKWLGLLFGAAFAVVFVAYVHGVLGAPVPIPQAYGLAWISTLYLGLVPLVHQVGVFRLEGWWVRAWLWFLGGLLVIGADLAFMGMWSMAGESALLLALAVGGWLYFPLRQWIWARLGPRARARVEEVLPDIVALASQGAGDRAQRRARWTALWERVYAPKSVRVLDEVVAQAQVRDQGRELWVPGSPGLPALALTLADRGERLFYEADARRCNEIAQLAQLSLRTQAAVDAGVRSERARIAADLHDDLGATLLSIAQTSGTGDQGRHVSRLARQALEQMRLSVRGLTREFVSAAEMLADWRAETVGRLELAGIDVQWRSNDPPPSLQVPARVQVQLTRVLREAVSNVIRHSGGRRCRVGVVIRADGLGLEVEDDGIGEPDARVTEGTGLSGIERRARLLGGAHELGRGEWGGWVVRVRVPLAQGEAR